MARFLMSAARKSILVTTSTLPRFEGDGEPRFVLDLCKELANFHDVVILGPADEASELHGTLEGIEVIRYRYAPFRSWETLTAPGSVLSRLRQNKARYLLIPPLFVAQGLALRRILRERHFDCIHCHWLVPQGFVQAAALGRPGDPPFVFTVHGSDAYSLDGWLGRTMKRYAISRAAGGTLVSRVALEFLRGRLGAEIFPEAVSVIPMGAHLADFHPERRADWWLKENGFSRPLILFVGRLSEGKGLKFLIEAMRLPPLRDGGATLCIVGDGTERAALERQVAAAGLSERVRFLGAVNHDRLPEIYASADCFCAPSIIASDGTREGLPVVLVEAAASGLPAIATDVGGIREIVEDGLTGFVVNQQDPQALSDRCARIVYDAALRQEMGVAARRHAEPFDWAVVGRKYAEFLSSIAEGRRPEGIEAASLTLADSSTSSMVPQGSKSAADAEDQVAARA